MKNSLVSKIIGFFRKYFHKTHRETEEIIKEESKEVWENPYLSRLRNITEQILAKKHINYADFFPVFIEGDDREEVLMALQQFADDLNHGALVCDNTVYYDGFAETMYEEQGLVIEFYDKEESQKTPLFYKKHPGNVIFDFETKGPMQMERIRRDQIYIPVRKKRWERTGNLDIAVPIGYNTVTVKDSESTGKQPEPDKFERAFYENKI